MSETSHPAPASRYRGLIALNLLAIALLCVVTFSQDATAQPSRSRVAGEYTMVSGKVQGRTEDAIYIIDTRNREMVAILYDRSQRRLVPIGAGYRNFIVDSGENARRTR